METPTPLVQHEKDYHKAAWQDYTLQELGSFVHLLAKRARHRNNRAKAEKDLYDARNYLKMMEATLDDLDSQVEQMVH